MSIVLLLGLLLANPGSDFQIVRVLATSDLHGRVRPSADFEAPGLPRRLLGGWEDLARLIDENRTGSCLLVDCGDFASGSPEARTTHGRAGVRFMNLVGYDAAAVGARDFSGGAENLEILARLATFPVLADPMLDVVLNRSVPLFRPFVVESVEGVRVAIIGLTDPDICRLNRRDDFRGLVVDDPVAQVRRYLPAVEAESAEVVIVIGHLGFEQGGALVDAFPEVDVVFVPAGEPGTEASPGRLIAAGGHLVPVGPYGQRLAVIDILFDRKERRVFQVEARSLNVLPGGGQVEDGRRVRALLDEVAVAGMDSSVCWLDDEFTPDENGRVGFGSLVAEAVRRSTPAELAVLPVTSVESGLTRGALTPRRLFEAVPHAEPLRYVLLDDTLLHRLVTGPDPGELAPVLAGADYFVMGDTVVWPLVGQVARVRVRRLKSRYSVVTTGQLLEQAGIEEMGRLVEHDLTELWVDWASAQDTLGPVPRARLYAATPGVLYPSREAGGRVNINTAGAAELEQLPGIGPRTAQRIVEYRLAHGRFGSVEELRNVKGIGPKKMEKIRPLAVTE